MAATDETIPPHEMQVEIEVYYSCQGHPAWPDPLRKQSFTEAVKWYRDNVDQHPGLRVIEVAVRSTQMIPLTPAPPRGRPNS